MGRVEQARWAGVKRRDAYRQLPPNTLRPRGGASGWLLREAGCPWGLGPHACPSEFSGLKRSSDIRTQRPGNSWGDLSKVVAQILGTGRISPGAPYQAVLSWVLGSSAWSGQEAPLQGCTEPMLKGLVDPRKLDVERSQLKALASPGKLPSPSLWEQATGGPQPRPPAQNSPKETAGAPLTPSGSCSWEGQLHTWLGL